MLIEVLSQVMVWMALQVTSNVTQEKLAKQAVGYSKLPLYKSIAYYNFVITILMVFCRGDFGLSNLQDGVLSSTFLVGLLMASPVFAYLAKTYVLTARNLFIYLFVESCHAFFIIILACELQFALAMSRIGVAIHLV